jgi:ribosomal protein S18 acetylase RimI-like enzyme
MSQGPVQPLRIACPSPAELDAAISLALAQLPADSQRRQLAQWRDAVRSDQAAVWVGYRGCKLAAAMIVQLQAGRTATLRVPRALQDEPPETASQLLSGVVATLRGKNVALAQALLEVDHGGDAELFCACGFRRAAELLYLVSLADAFPTSLPADGLEFVVYATSEHARLAAIVEQTYEGSLDCPQFDKLRNIEDILAGYRAVGRFDPGLWMIARHEARDVGCLLLADEPAHHACELVYLGVVPRARGRGFGVALARHAQWIARQRARERVTAAVDAANWPAIDAYAAAGFAAWDKRSVFLRSF